MRIGTRVTWDCCYVNVPTGEHGGTTWRVTPFTDGRGVYLGVKRLENKSERRTLRHQAAMVKGDDGQVYYVPTGRVEPATKKR